MSKRGQVNEEYRAMAVQMALSSKNKAAVARELGIPAWKLNNWVAVYRRREARGDSAKLHESLKAELAADKKRIAQLELELEIVKKAAAYFAKGLQ